MVRKRFSYCEKRVYMVYSVLIGISCFGHLEACGIVFSLIALGLVLLVNEKTIIRAIFA